VDTERELFDLFIESSHEMIAALKAAHAAGHADDWRAAAHAWKGSSINLGA